MPCKLINEELFHKMKQLIKREISFLQPFLSANMFDEFFKKTKKEYPYVGRFIEDRLPGYFNDYYVHLVTEEHKKEMQELPEYVIYRETMLADSIIARHFRDKVGNPRSVLTLYDWSFFYYILDLMLKSYFVTGKFDDKLFDELYCDLESFLYNERIPLTIVAPLHNFKSDASAWNLNSINLDEGLLIRKITNEERDMLWENMVWNRLTFGDIGMFEYVIQYRANERKFLVNEQEYESSIDDAQKVLNNVITTLRLQHNGAVGYSNIDCRDTLKIPVLIGESLARGPFMSYGNDKFWLKESDITSIQQLYHELKNIESTKNLALFLALERFNSAYSDSSMEDKIIDFAISYEVLFSQQGEGTDSVNHKLAVRSSRLIKEDYGQRIQLCRTMKKLYGKRSDIIHGNIKESNQQEKEYVTRDFEENMRISLNKYIERFNRGNYNEHSDLIQEIDFG
jgi:hypothetical protein